MFRWDHSAGHNRLSREGNSAHACEGWVIYDDQCIWDPLWEFAYLFDAEAAAGWAGRSRVEHDYPGVVGEAEPPGVECRGTEEEKGCAGEADKGEEAGGG